MRHLAVTFAAVCAFALGIVARDGIDSAHATAVIGGGGSSISIATGSGGAVGVVGPQSITGPLSVTGQISATLGVSAATGLFSGAMTLAGPVSITGPVGVTSSASIGITVTTTGAGDGIRVAVGGGSSAAGIRTTGGGTSAGLIANGGSSGGDGVTATGGGTASAVNASAGAANGVGVTATNTLNGYALRITGDTTSPTQASVRMDALDTNPTGTAAFGDYFIFLSGSQIVMRMATATTPAWNDVSGLHTVITGITAHAGGGQASATPVCTNAANTVIATVGSANDSIGLPATPALGQTCVFKNKGANTLALFPGTTDVICVSGSACGAGDASTTIAANAEMTCWAESAATWNCR